MDQKSIESEDMFQYVTLKIEEDRVVKHVALILSFTCNFSSPIANKDVYQA